MSASNQPKTILVTGATDGIGWATALELARRGHTVIVHGRSTEKTQRTHERLLAELPNANARIAVADFSSLEQVRRMAADVRDRFERLDVLINNAGVFSTARALSADGYELTFAVNHLAPFLLTNELLPLLRASRARVVTVSSVAHRNGKIDFDDLDSNASYQGYAAYARSKLANVHFAQTLAERERGVITSNALHPGGVTTKLLQIGFGMSGISVEDGAKTSVFLAVDPSVEGVTGKYYSDSRVAPTSPSVLDRSVGERLWEVSERLTRRP